MSFKYYIAPFHIDSEFPLERAPLPHDVCNEPDIRIRRVHSSPALKERQTFSGAGYWGNPHEMLLIPVPRFEALITKAGDVSIFTTTNDHGVIAEMLARVIMPAVFLLRGWLLLHGAANLCAGGAVVFLADSGVGKSTLNAFLAQNGFPSLGDDIIALTDGPAGEDIAVAPNFSRIHLDNESTRLLGLDEDRGVEVNPEKHAYWFASPKSIERPPPLSGVYLLSRSDECSPNIESIAARDGLVSIIHHLLDPAVAHYLGQTHLEITSRIARTVPFYKFELGNEGFTRKHLAVLNLESESYASRPKPVVAS